MNKKNTIAIAFSCVALASLVGVFCLSNNEVLSSKANDEKEILDVTSTSITLSNNYTVQAVSEGFTDGDLFSLSKYGYIRNNEPIRGITSISVSYATGSAKAKIVPCYYDYENKEVAPTSETWPDASGVADFSGAPVDYFEIYNGNEEDISITSISIAYGCSTSTYTFNVSFTPNWIGDEADNHADIFIAGTPELISDGTSSGNWNYKKMIYVNGSYIYNSPNYLPVGKYAYNFYAVKNGASISWSNPCLEGMQTIELNSNFNDNTSYSWNSEPGSATTYILNIIYKETASGAWTTWRGFNFSTASSNIYDGAWGDNLSWVEKVDGVDIYQCNSFEFESSSTTVYVSIKGSFKDSNSQIDPGYIGSSTTNAFAVNYVGGATTATLTVNMTLSAASQTYAATSYDVETSGGTDVSGMSHVNVSMGIYDLDQNNTSITNGRRLISPTFESGTDTFTPSYSGNNIRIDKIDGNYYITALKAGTTTTVTLTADSDSSIKCNFNVTIPSSTYSATSTRDASEHGGSGDKNVSENEGWFVSTDVDEIDGMGSDFFNGVDISSCKALYLNGSNFYNTSGVEQSLFYILKEAGVNWVRLKLWVDPYTTGGISYGGGDSDLNNTLWMAYEAKQAGFNLLLDLHYSDWWTHPGQQVLPKAWSNASSVSELCNYIKNYTKNTLNTFNSNGCLPDMVQLGNEISSGSFLKKAGANSETWITDIEEDSTNAFKPNYLLGASNFAYSASSGSDNMKSYLSAGIEAVNEINSSLNSDIKTVIHWAKGSSIGPYTIPNFFNNFSSLDYDYAAISYYPYDCFNNLTEGNSYLSRMNTITNANGTVPWFIAETSYPFSDGSTSWVYEEISGRPTYKVTDALVGSGSSGKTSIVNYYPYNASGQANLIHDLTETVINNGGKGIFYWEPAWVPNAYVGYAIQGSSCTWSNQGFFSYNGKAIANIDLFAQMSPYIN